MMSIGFFRGLLFLCIAASARGASVRLGLVRRIVARSVVGAALSIPIVSQYEMEPAFAAAIVAEGQGDTLSTRQKVIRGTENFLTNPVLETLRKADQLDVDDNGGKNKALFLIPILRMREDLQSVQSLLKETIEQREKAMASLTSAKELIGMDEFKTPVLKKIFNRYADNIYYSDPKQANLYLAGGAMPNSLQTQQYLVRNEILTKLDDIKQDVNELHAVAASGSQLDRQLVLDAEDDVREALSSFELYFSMAEEKDLSLAQAAYKSKEEL